MGAATPRYVAMTDLHVEPTEGCGAHLPPHKHHHRPRSDDRAAVVSVHPELNRGAERGRSRYVCATRRAGGPTPHPLPLLQAIEGRGVVRLQPRSTAAFIFLWTESLWRSFRPLVTVYRRRAVAPEMPTISATPTVHSQHPPLDLDGSRPAPTGGIVRDCRTRLQKSITSCCHG